MAFSVFHQRACTDLKSLNANHRTINVYLACWLGLNLRSASIYDLTFMPADINTFYFNNISSAFLFIMDISPRFTFTSKLS